MAERKRRALTRRAFVGAAGIASACALGALVGCGRPAAGGAGDGEVGGLDASDTPFDEQAQLRERAREAVAALSLEQKAAQLFIVRPEALAPDDFGTQAAEATRTAMAARPVGGVAYFGPNLLDPDQTSAMLAATQGFSQEACGLPALLCVDEEGGTVARIGRNDGFDAPDVGDMAAVGQTGDPAAARQAALTIGGYLVPLGFNVDFAPSADVADNPESDVMALRSFGDDPQLVAAMVRAQVEGFNEAGICCAVKHFPGIGAAEGDSHQISIYSHKTSDELAADELVPFQAAIEAGVPLVMVGHLSTPEATGDDVPASLSPAMVNGVLRGQMGFDGVVVTDSLGMGAVSERYDVSEVAVLALEAGCDIALMPASFDAAYQGVLDAVAAGRLTEARITESAERIALLKLTLDSR